MSEISAVDFDDCYAYHQMSSIKSNSILTNITWEEKMFRIPDNFYFIQSSHKANFPHQVSLSDQKIEGLVFNHRASPFVCRDSVGGSISGDADLDGTVTLEVEGHYRSNNEENESNTTASLSVSGGRDPSGNYNGDIKIKVEYEREF